MTRSTKIIQSYRSKFEYLNNKTGTCFLENSIQEKYIEVLNFVKQRNHFSSGFLINTFILQSFVVQAKFKQWKSLKLKTFSEIAYAVLSLNPSNRHAFLILSLWLKMCCSFCETFLVLLQNTTFQLSIITLFIHI